MVLTHLTTGAEALLREPHVCVFIRLRMKYPQVSLIDVTKGQRNEEGTHPLEATQTYALLGRQSPYVAQKTLVKQSCLGKLLPAIHSDSIPLLLSPGSHPAEVEFVNPLNA